MSLLDKLSKNSTLKNSSVFSQSNMMASNVSYSTKLKVLNVAFSGSLDGGFGSGLTQFAGPSKHFKTMLMLLCAAAFLRDEPEGVVVFYDNEFGASSDYFESLGIDTDRVFHIPFMHIEDLKFDMVKKLEAFDRKDKVMIIIDSIGNAASKKEVEDAKDEKSVADMTRAKAIKSLWRIVTPYLTMKDIPCITVNHVYSSQGLFASTVVSGGTGIMYSSNNVFIIGRSQVKDGRDVVGYDFKINIEKSRGCREKSVLPFTVTYDGGINEYAGLFELARELGYIKMVSSGWYSRVLNGEVEDKKWRLKDAEFDDEFWKPILESDFNETVKSRFKLVSKASTDVEENDIELDKDIDV